MLQQHRVNGWTNPGQPCLGAGRTKYVGFFFFFVFVFFYQRWDYRISGTYYYVEQHLTEPAQQNRALNTCKLCILGITTLREVIASGGDADLG